MNHTHRRKKSGDSKSAVDRDAKPNWMKWALNAKAAMKSKSEVNENGNDKDNFNGSSPNVAPMFCTDDWSIDYTPKKKNPSEKSMLGKRSVSVRFDLSALSIDYDKCQPQGAKSETTSVLAVGEDPNEGVSIFDAFKEASDWKDKDDRIDVLLQEKDGLLVKLDEASTENANVVEQCFDLASENESLKGENEKLKHEKVEMKKQLDEASMENENVVEHCFDLACENEALKVENETLKMTMAEMKGAFLGATTKSKKQSMVEGRKKDGVKAIYGASEVKMTAMERQFNLRREKKDLRVARRKKKTLLVAQNALKKKAKTVLDDAKASNETSTNESDAGLDIKTEVPHLETPQMFWVMDFMEKSPGCSGEKVVGDMKDNTLANKKTNWFDCVFPWLSKAN